MRSLFLLALFLAGGAGLRPNARTKQSVVKNRCKHPQAKGVAGHRFSLDMWYGDDDDQQQFEKKNGQLWVSPWAKAHYKLRQQEIEIENCEFMLKEAVKEEDYTQANGLQERIARLKSQHPILPREERVEMALADGNFALAAVFQNDLDRVKENLGLPRYGIGQVVRHKFRKVRGVVINVDLVCVKGVNWVQNAGCLERGLALGIPPDECNMDELQRWTQQPFYTVLPDLQDYDEFWEARLANGTGGWAEEEGLSTPPREIWAWQVNRFSKLPPPLYIAEQSIEFVGEVSHEPKHPELSELFDGFDASEHRGRIYRASPRLRLWQQEQAVKQQEAMMERKQQKVGYKLRDGTQWLS